MFKEVLIMLSGKIAIHEIFKEDFDEIKSFCDLNDIQIHRLDPAWCVVLAKPKRMYKLMKFARKHGGKVINIELVD